MDDGAPNGLKIHKDGRIFIADAERGIMLLDPDNGKVTSLLERSGEAFKGLNDLVFAASGDLFFTDQGQTGLHDSSGRVYRLSTTGELTCLIDNLPSPNGIVVSLDMTFLLVAITRTNQIWRVPLHPSGLILKVGCFANLHGGPAGPDGLAFDQEGALLGAHAGCGVVWRLSSRAEPLARIQSCVPGFSQQTSPLVGQGRQPCLSRSMGSAAKALGITQPGVSQAISDLED